MCPGMLADTFREGTPSRESRPEQQRKSQKYVKINPGDNGMIVTGFDKKLRGVENSKREEFHTTAATQICARWEKMETRFDCAEGHVGGWQELGRSRAS